MAKLILSLDGQAIKEHDVSKERMTIGRKPHNDIQIDNLAVSGEHAMIMTILNDSFLEDLGSTNGTMVNGRPVKKHFLQNEDIVEIGKYKLKYENAQAGKVTQQEFEQTMVLRAPPGGGIPAKPPSGTESPAKLKSVDSTATATGTGGAAATSTSGITTNLKPVGTQTQTNASSATASGGGLAPAGASQSVAPAGASPQPVAPVGASEPVAVAGASPQRSSGR
jgi:pSer/pThr/pTyr-binding forkhead associated (FHA) protein